jgi:hypothetical protein
MKTIQSFLALGLATACALPAFSQDETPANSSLLGKRYVEAAFIVTDTQNMPDTGYGLGTAVNAPLTSNLDIGASFTHNWAGNDEANEFQDLAAYITFYQVYGDFRPFATATLGYQWWQTSNDPWYQFEVGGEYLVTERLSLSAQVSWSEFLTGDWDGGQWGVGARANYWLTKKLATSATIAYTESGTWTYSIGVLFQF